MSEELEPSIVRLRWQGGGEAAAVTLAMRHFQRPLSAEEIRALADIVEQIEAFRELVRDPEGLELP